MTNRNDPEPDAGPTQLLTAVCEYAKIPTGELGRIEVLPSNPPCAEFQSRSRAHRPDSRVEVVEVVVPPNLHRDARPASRG